MKRLAILFLALFAVIFSAYKTIDYATTEQMKDYANDVVGSYGWNHHLRLYGITGSDLNWVVCPMPNNHPDSLYSSLYKKSKSDYHQWVKTTALKNRKAVIAWITEERLNEMLGYINDAAIEKKMSLAGRDSLFKELRSVTGHYLNRFLKLQSATPVQRGEILKCSAIISPRNKAYSLQGQMFEGASKNSNLIGVAKELKARLALVGIKLEEKCDDFADYPFTRYSKQYDYLFSLVRWSTYMDGGKITEDGITGWTEPTAKGLIDDGVVLLQKTKKAVDAYQVK